LEDHGTLVHNISLLKPQGNFNNYYLMAYKNNHILLGVEQWPFLIQSTQENSDKNSNLFVVQLSTIAQNVGRKMACLLRNLQFLHDHTLVSLVSCHDIGYVPLHIYLPSPSQEEKYNKQLYTPNTIIKPSLFEFWRFYQHKCGR